MPYRLKHWLDLVVQVGVTVKVNENFEYIGQVTGRPLQMIIASGSPYESRFPSRGGRDQNRLHVVLPQPYFPLYRVYGYSHVTGHAYGHSGAGYGCHGGKVRGGRDGSGKNLLTKSILPALIFAIVAPAYGEEE